MATVVKRSLTAHKALLAKVIKDQAGTLDKGCLEGTMNGIEAGSDEVRFITSEDGKTLRIEDDGKGFRSIEEIQEWFEQFGTPHQESEGKIWARFRMGRGQLFAFGRNTWRTGEFRMVVDIDKMGLEYELETGLPHVDGCQIEIELYQPMFGDYPCPYRSQSQFKAALRKLVLYMEGRILVDGDRINTPASHLDWDVETDEWYFSFGHGSNFDWYNLGAYCMTWSPRQAGVTGVAVSKLAVDVNFARNDIKDACPIYQRGKAIVSQNKVKKVRKAQRRLSENEKVSVLLDLRNGDCSYNDIKNLGLFMTCSDTTMSLEAIRKIRSPWTFAPKESRIADRLMQTDKAICLSDEILGDLSYDGDEADFFDWLLYEADFSHDGRQPLKKMFAPMRSFWREFDSSNGSGLSSGFTESFVIIPSNKLSKPEIRFLKVMQDMNIWKGRTLCIGISDVANGWTDGQTYIAFDRDYLRRNFPSGSWGAAAMMTLAFHEMAHDTSDVGSHFHGAEFYKAYHDMTRGSSLHWIATLAGKMARQKWVDQTQVEQEKERKKQERREKKLGIKKAQAKLVAETKKETTGGGLTHTPTKAPAKKKVRGRRRRQRF